MWRWDQQEPFGVNVPDENPAGLGVFEFPLMLSLYYRDNETGNLYAQQRDAYDPQIGRFPQSDPIALAGGLNTYAYVDANPLSFIDPSGLGKIGFCIRTVKNIWKKVGRDRAALELAKKGDVLVSGSGASSKAKSLAKEVFGNKTARHDAHGSKQLPHYQHRNGGRGHVFYNSLGNFTAVGLFGENVLTQGIDFFNPVSDARDVVGLFTEDEEQGESCGCQ